MRHSSPLTVPAGAALAAAVLAAAPAAASIPLAALRALTAQTSPTETARAAALPARPPTPAVRPNARELAPTVETAQARDSMPEARADAPMQFIVKFEEDEARQWIDRYVADPDAARRAFAELGRRNSVFAGLRLLRINNSGEATLEFEGAAPPMPEVAREMASDIARRLSAADGVEYAEPNLVGLRESDS